ncbi:hypothetical protein C4544_01700 [candidate division WS5 bacterium]|uniref:Uncharacterized protein n=1 Tax=candidate division WS5 bacterium TaxID=2093353 RepID=A0A419DFL6_9BACT|nr:MAG: hypothetical protein C4544_01700 [candidate division WS5 bacterium]
MDEKDIKKIEEVFKYHIGILSEDVQRKLDIVTEGYQMLSEKLDCLESRFAQRVNEIDAKLSKKIDAVATDLAAHRADTESHKAGYRISESRD